jgi:hypothetical protein
MNLKTTVVLAAILILMSAYFFFSRMDSPKEGVEARPDAWSVEESFIERIEVRLLRQDKRASFLRSQQGNWHFDNIEKLPVDIKRWAGIVLLVSGPQSKRQIRSKAGDEAQYGLTDPRMVIIIDVRNPGRRLEVLVGDRTPDEEHDYVKLRDYDVIYLVHRSWGTVLERLVTDPPLPPS